MKVRLAEGFLDGSRVGVALLNCVGNSLSLRVGNRLGLSERVTLGKKEGLGVVFLDGFFDGYCERILDGLLDVGEFERVVGDLVDTCDGLSLNLFEGDTLGVLDCIDATCARDELRLVPRFNVSPETREIVNMTIARTATPNQILPRLFKALEYEPSLEVYDPISFSSTTASL